MMPIMRPPKHHHSSGDKVLKIQIDCDEMEYEQKFIQTSRVQNQIEERKEITGRFIDYNTNLKPKTHY